MENLDPTAAAALSGSAEDIMQRQQLQEQAKQQREMRLDQILEPSAKERLERLALVKPDVVEAVGDSFINAAKNGQLRAKVTDEQLKNFLEQMAEGDGPIAGKKSKKIVIQRRKYDMDDEEDDDDSDLV